MTVPALCQWERKWHCVSEKESGTVSVRKKGALKARCFRGCESQSADCWKLFRCGLLLFCAGVPVAGVHHRVMPAVPVQTLQPCCSGCLSGSSQWQRPHRPGQKQKLGKQCLVHIYLDRSAWRWKGAFPFTCSDSVRDWLSHNYILSYSHWFPANVTIADRN